MTGAVPGAATAAARYCRGTVKNDEAAASGPAVATLSTTDDLHRRGDGGGAQDDRGRHGPGAAHGAVK
ncbi:hypothetical protein GCM10027091_45370 [Streptomyces daliensis]